MVTVFHDDIDNKGREGRENGWVEIILYPKTNSLPIIIAYSRMLSEVNNVKTSNSEVVSSPVELPGQLD